MKQVLFILVIAFLATYSNGELPSQFVIGGRDASPGQFPFMASIRLGSEKMPAVEAAFSIQDGFYL